VATPVACWGGLSSLRGTGFFSIFSGPYFFAGCGPDPPPFFAVCLRLPYHGGGIVRGFVLAPFGRPVISVGALPTGVPLRFTVCPVLGCLPHCLHSALSPPPPLFSPASVLGVGHGIDSGGQVAGGYLSRAADRRRFPLLLGSARQRIFFSLPVTELMF
jgi:hypothetical protein